MSRETPEPQPTPEPDPTPQPDPQPEPEPVPSGEHDVAGATPEETPYSPEGDH